MPTTTILVVDDSSTMRAIITMNLKSMPGVVIVEACHGRDARAMGDHLAAMRKAASRPD